MVACLSCCAGLMGALALPMTLTTAMKVAFGSKWLSDTGSLVPVDGNLMVASLSCSAGLVGALALPMTLTTAMKVAFGSKWLVALRRAQAAGKMLAMQLAQVIQGMLQDV